MKYYLDTDIFLAVIKQQDRFKDAAFHFLQQHRNDELYTSNMCCLEIWFYLYKNNCRDKILHAFRSIQQMCVIIETSTDDLTEGILLAQEYNLSPVDSLHALHAQHLNIPLISSDKAFDRVKGIRRIDFTIK